MKLIRVDFSGYKNCKEIITFDLLAKSSIISNDIGSELNEIDENLFTFNNVAVIGKNASGKTTVLEVLLIVYDLLTKFRLDNNKKYNIDNDMNLSIYFHHEHSIYKYNVLIKKNPLTQTYNLNEEIIYKKQYYKSYIKNIYEFKNNDKLELEKNLPCDTSLLFHVITTSNIHCLSYDEYEFLNSTFVFNLLKNVEMSDSLINIIKVFDSNIDYIRKDGDYLLLSYLGDLHRLTLIELYSFLSRGTSKGIILYSQAVYALVNGLDLLVDEIEVNFHKTLVNYLLLLFKDERVNKKNARLIFTTHYCELLDTFNRSDNIFLCKSKDTIILENIYTKYKIRNGILKSNLFYDNYFDTAVSYKSLMDLKKDLIND